VLKMANGPGVGMPNSTPDQTVNQLEFLRAAGLEGVFDSLLPQDNTMVYMGPEYNVQYFGSTTTASSVTGAGEYMNRDAAMNMFFRMTPKQRQEWDGLIAAIDGKAPDEFRSNSVWRTTVGYAQEANRAMPNNPMSPTDILRIQARNAIASGANQRGGRSTTSRVINFTNESDAAYLIDNTLQQYLGRQATDEERDTFLKTLNKLEKKSPYVSTPTQRSGGVRPEQVAREFARSRPEAAETRATGQFMDWFMEKLAEDPTKGVESGL